MMTKTTKLFMLLILCLGFAAQSFGQNQKTADDYLQEGIGYFNAKNYGNAVESFQKSSSMGNHVATSNLGICYENGFGVEKDPVKAVEMYQKAADNGYVGAKRNLANCYYYGVGVERDYYKAVELFQQAAENGDPNAQNTLGICYQYGNGVSIDYARLCSGTRNRPCRATCMPSKTLPYAISTEPACRRTMPRQWNGIRRLPARAISRL